MILVVGATGVLGGAIARLLLQRAEPVRVLARAGSPFEELVAAGAHPVLGDMKDPESLRTACGGVDTVVTTANSASRGGADTVDTVDRSGNRNLVEAATAAGVRRYMFISAAGADSASPDPFFQAKAETEQRVRDSGMSWTVLAPEPFMDVWIPAVVGSRVLAGQPVTIVGEGRRRHSLVAVRDVAAYAVAALANPAADRQTLVVGGPEPITWRDVIGEFERSLGRTVPVRTVPPGEPVPGLPPPMTGLLAYLDSYESPIDMTDTAATFGVTGTSLARWVDDFLR